MIDRMEVRRGVSSSFQSVGSGYQIYWGDLHNHCAISYGHGSLGRALAVARQQLDFTAVTGHAFWPDMPDDRSRYARIIDFHERGFAKLHANWSDVQEKVELANAPGAFVTFPCYEWHCRQDGDYYVLYAGPDGPLIGGERVSELKAALRAAEQNGHAPAALAIPHHIGYPEGCRGINWDSYSEDASPFVEIYSLHGCAESDEAPYPMLHTMGPRVGPHLATAGLRAGHRFGLVASTDHHSGYPGSYGYGRLGTYASALTREALWEAFLARRVYAVTGDKIQATLRVNDAWPGASIDGNRRTRHLAVDVQARDFIDHIELLKNERIIRRWSGPDPARAASLVSTAGGRRVRATVRIEWGWGDVSSEVQWDARLSLEDGQLHAVETCFAGPAVVAPKDHDDALDDVLPHRLIDQDERGCAWESSTTGNPTVRHSATQAIILDLEAPVRTGLCLQVNGKSYRVTLAELLEGSRGVCLEGFVSEAIVFHHAVPRELSRFQREIDDWPRRRLRAEAEAGRETDWYRLRVCQRNGQWAWLSPIWVTG